MRRSLPSFGLLVLSVSAITTTACDSTVAFTATGPAPLSANINVSGSFGVEPSIIRPERLPGSCGAHSPFGLRLGVTIRGGEDVILRSVRFAFDDRNGRRALPEVTPLPSLTSPVPAGATTLPSSAPVPVPGNAPLPTTAPIPIPGASPITGVLVPAGSERRFAFFLQFTCIVFPQGEVVVVIDSARGGRFETSELRVPVD